MKVLDIPALARAAISANPAKPATAVIHDSPDARLVVFRIGPGQQVAVHTNKSTVLLSVVAGSGLVTGADGERAVQAGDVVAYAPEEPHGMRADAEELIIVATIAPRSGDR